MVVGVTGGSKSEPGKSSGSVFGADGLGADGVGVDGVGVGVDGVGADGVGADGVGADGVGADGEDADDADTGESLPPPPPQLTNKTDMKRQRNILDINKLLLEHINPTRLVLVKLILLIGLH
ncbi:MAG: hypothetical protein GKR92_06870 [Gammaproteobacteria bacterium]|nr:MAG: hypothetical protein GKR92_06870 [Gammaproteobacteria bacterium]